MKLQILHVYRPTRRVDIAGTRPEIPVTARLVCANVRRMRFTLSFGFVAIGSIVAAADQSHPLGDGRNVTQSLAEEVPVAINDACPFEGCVFGRWQIFEDVSVYPEPVPTPDPDMTVATLEAGSFVDVESARMFLHPGVGIVGAEASQVPEGIRHDKHVYILDYLGEGNSRVYQQRDRLLEVPIARTHSQCDTRPHWSMCWVDIVKEPLVASWWLKLSAGGGWVLVPESSYTPPSSGLTDRRAMIPPKDR